MQRLRFIIPGRKFLFYESSLIEKELGHRHVTKEGLMISCRKHNISLFLKYSIKEFAVLTKSYLKSGSRIGPNRTSNRSSNQAGIFYYEISCRVSQICQRPRHDFGWGTRPHWDWRENGAPFEHDGLFKLQKKIE